MRKPSTACGWVCGREQANEQVLSTQLNYYADNQDNRIQNEISPMRSRSRQDLIGSRVRVLQQLYP